MPPTKCESFGEKQSKKTRVSQVRWEKTGTNRGYGNVPG